MNLTSFATAKNTKWFDVFFSKSTRVSKACLSFFPGHRSPPRVGGGGGAVQAGADEDDLPALEGTKKCKMLVRIHHQYADFPLLFFSFQAEVTTTIEKKIGPGGWGRCVLTSMLG